MEVIFVSDEIKKDHVLVASCILDTFYDEYIDTRFIFSVCVEPNAEIREHCIEALKALGRGQDLVVIDCYVFLRQTYVHPETTCPMHFSITMFHPTYQRFYSKSVPMPDKIMILDYHKYKCKLDYLYDALYRLNRDYPNGVSLREKLKEMFNMRSPILDSESILPNPSHVTTITARSGYGKSWICEKLMMMVLSRRNKEIDLRGTNIMKVIYNYPATIVLWDDGTKTIVKARNGDPFDHEKGLAMAIAKKALGNDNRYYMAFQDAQYDPVETKPKNWDTEYYTYYTRSTSAGRYKEVKGVTDRKTGKVKIPEFISGKYFKKKCVMQ
jgi:hypothetical protein